MKNVFKDKDLRSKFIAYTLCGILIISFYLLCSKIGVIFNFIKQFIYVLSPFIWGVSLAFVLHKLEGKIEKIFPKKMKLKHKRAVSSVITVLLAVVVVAGIIILISPYLVESVKQITQSVYKFTSSAPSWIKTIQNKFNISSEVLDKIYSYSVGLVSNIWEIVQSAVPSIIDITVNTVEVLFNFLIGFLVAVYVLIDRDNLLNSFKKFFKAILSEKAFKRGTKVYYLIKTKFHDCVVGKLLDSFVVGVLCLILMLILNIEYPVLISLIVFITNIVPFIGPLIGEVVGTIILLILSPKDALIYLIMVFALQQLDGNVIGPKIVGDSVGLSALWTMFAAIVGGAYFGLFGMLLGVPVFAVIYYLISDYVNEKLMDKENETH